jgi:hypothetical protein
MFGLPMDKDAERYWGARAIYKGPWDKWAPCSIDILHDRQGMTGITHPDKQDGVSQYKLDDDKKFIDWCNKVALPWLREKLKKHKLYTDSKEHLRLIDGPYKLTATPNASHGYMYIGCVELNGDPPFIDEGTA